MRWCTPLSVAGLALLTLVAPVRAQIPAPERKLLEQSAETYRSITRYLLEGVVQIDVRSERGPQSQQAPFVIAVDGTGRIRDEITTGVATGLFVSDGRETVVYNGQLRQYMRMSGGADSIRKKFANRGVGSMMIARYTALVEGARSARRLPNETLTVNGVPRVCDVVEVTYDPQNTGIPIIEEPRRFWFDHETHLVVRQHTVMHADSPQIGGKVDQEETITFRRATIDPRFPDSLWVFRPPEGAQLVDQFRSGPADPATAFAGRPAIDFTLKDLKGRPHSLKSLRGKVVLLDFWATWCGPCRLTMPQVAKIHTQYKGKGVEVMSINVGETSEKAAAFIAKNGYLFTTLLDQDRAVATQYQVNGIPTLVVVDASGKVSDYMVGVRDEAALKAALKKAGVQ